MSCGSHFIWIRALYHQAHVCISHTYLHYSIFTLLLTLQSLQSLVFTIFPDFLKKTFLVFFSLFALASYNGCVLLILSSNLQTTWNTWFPILPSLHLYSTILSSRANVLDHLITLQARKCTPFTNIQNINQNSRGRKRKKKFHTARLPTLSATAQNLVSRGTWKAWFVHPCYRLEYYLHNGSYEISCCVIVPILLLLLLF